MTSTPSYKPRKAPRQQRSIATVRVILQATTRVLKHGGYAALTTNAVAEAAGVSVGSVYQYFPNKESLLAALYALHAAEMAAAIGDALREQGPAGLLHDVRRLVRAAVAAHEVDPELHRILDKEFPIFKQDQPVGADVFGRVRALLERNAEEIGGGDLDLVAWMTMRLTESLVHAAVLNPWQGASAAAMEAEIVNVIFAYLAARGGAVCAADAAVAPR